MTRELATAAFDYTALSPIISPQQQVTLLLLESLQKLADAGEADAACRIAGKACVILRASPQDERRFNVLLHRLVRRL